MVFPLSRHAVHSATAGRARKRRRRPRRRRSSPRRSLLRRGDGGRVTITVFFQFKGEAQDYFKTLAPQFEKENPDIHVVVDNPADPETALRTRLVKNDVPDVMTLNANGTFGEFATAKIFRDFSDDPVLDDVNPAFVKVLGDLGRGGDGRGQRCPVRRERQRPALQRGALRQVRRRGAARPSTS